MSFLRSLDGAEKCACGHSAPRRQLKGESSAALAAGGEPRPRETGVGDLAISSTASGPLHTLRLFRLDELTVLEYFMLAEREEGCRCASKRRSLASQRPISRRPWQAPRVERKRRTRRVGNQPQKHSTAAGRLPQQQPRAQVPNLTYPTRVAPWFMAWTTDECTTMMAG